MGKNGHLDKFTRRIDKMIRVGDLLGLGVFEFLLLKTLHQRGFAASDSAHESDTIAIAGHRLGVGDVVGDVESQSVFEELNDSANGRVHIADGSGDNERAAEPVEKTDLDSGSLGADIR